MRIFNTKVSNKGFGLASTMAILGVMIILSSILVVVLISLANFGRLSDNGEKAEDLARAIVATAQAHLDEDPNWGKDSATSLAISEDEGWGGSAYLSFSAADPKLSSVWNMEADSALKVGGLEHYVPARSVQLIGVAEVGQVRKVYEVVLNRKGLEFAIASSGPLTMKGKNEAAAFESLAELEGLDFQNGVPKADLLDGNQRKTSVASLDTMTLEKQLTLYGDAVSTGNIEGAEANVTFLAGGKAKPFTESVSLPELDAQDYNPLRADSPIESKYVKRPPGSSFTDPTFTGFNYSQSPQVNLTGEVRLEQAQYHVKGDCVINGNLTGSGLLSVEGDLIIQGQANLEAASQLAVVVNGDIVFRGQGKSQSLFKGLLFSQGAAQLSNISVIGGAYANNPTQPDKASLELSDVTLVEQTETQTFDLKTEIGAPEYDLGGQIANVFSRNGVTVINPKTSDYIGPDGIYNEIPISFGVKMSDGTVYATVEEAIANITDGQILNALGRAKVRAETAWVTELKKIKPGDYKELPIFQFDPNTVLNEASQWKVILPGQMRRI